MSPAWLQARYTGEVKSAFSKPGKRRPLSHANKLFIALLSLFQWKLPTLFLATDASHRLQRSVQQHGKSIPSLVNYDIEALDFNRAFFLKNLYKNLYFISWLQKHGFVRSSSRVIDIGAGAGIASIAWDTICHNEGTVFCLYDRSHTHLKLAQQVLAVANITQAKFYQEEVASFEALQAGVSILSYWVCEQPSLPVIHSIQAFCNRIQDGIIVIDYPEHVQRFADWMQSYTLGKGAIVQEFHTERLPRIIRDKVLEDRITLTGYFWKP